MICFHPGLWAIHCHFDTCLFEVKLGTHPCQLLLIHFHCILCSEFLLMYTCMFFLCVIFSSHVYLVNSCALMYYETYILIFYFNAWNSFLFKDFIYFLERGEGKEKEKERNINVCLPLMCPQLGIWPTMQACALTGNWTSNPLVCRPKLNPLGYTSQG